MKSDSDRSGVRRHRVHVTAKTKELLLQRADWYEDTEHFPTPDPSELLKVSGKRNQEATAFVAACLSFGKVEQFKPKIEQLIEWAKDSGGMDQWIRRGAFKQKIQAGVCRCFYRFVTYSNLCAFLRAYQQIMREHGTLGEYVRRNGDETGLGAVKAICAAFADSDVGCLVPANASSACKRICLFLRWMVREPPIDLGLWKGFIDRGSLIMPLDAHVLKQARELKLLANEPATMATARKLTEIMSKVFPGDPLRGDFALFGQGRSGGEEDDAPHASPLLRDEGGVKK